MSGTESISDNSVEGGSTGSASETETTTKSTDTRTGPKRTSLTDLSGSSEYVTVEAIVNEVFCVNKDESDIPDIIGALKDENTGERRTFIVNDGVNHPYLEEGRRFLFRNAVDHCYKKKDQVQLMITQYTEFSDLGFPHTSTPSSGQSRSRKSSNSSSSGEKSLGQIAQSMLGDEEFTMTEGRESAISKAKKKAKRQQRDPAIDPKLNDK